MKKILTFAAALLIGTGSMMADEVSVGNVTIPLGGQATVSISLANPDKVYTAGQMLMVLPEGVTAALKENGDPMTAKGERLNGTSHTIGASHLEDGTDQFTIFSISSEAIPGAEGSLFTITVTADAELAVGASLEGRLTNIELTTTDGIPAPFNNQAFTITIGEPSDTHILLDENSTTAPEAATGVDVRVRRTINANEWSTICLPFAMTEAQVKATFGDDVQLGDFTGVDSEFDDDDNVVGIKAEFSDVTAIEANHPYIIKVSAPVTEFTLDGVDIVADEDEAYIEFDNGKTGSRRVVYSGFYGTYHAGTVLDEFTLFLSDNKFWYSTGKTKMKAFRAYFAFLDVLTSVEEGDYSSRIMMHFGGKGTTGVQSVAVAQQQTGQAVYDLQGRRVEQPAKGLYVKDGKKVIIK